MKSFILSFLLIINVSANTDLEKYIDIFKEYSEQGKNVFIEQTLLNGINALVDNTKIKINSFDIDDETDAIKIDIF